MTKKVPRFSFCPKCGKALMLKLVKEHERLVCGHCNYVMYENPVVGVAIILQMEDRKILLGKRAKCSTYPGLWCIPCGYVEYNEEVREAAIRECREETGLDWRFVKSSATGIRKNFARCFPLESLARAII